MVITVSSSSSEDEEDSNPKARAKSATSRRQRRGAKRDDDADAKDPDASMSDGGSDEEDSGYSEAEDMVKPPAAKKRKITGSKPDTTQRRSQKSSKASSLTLTTSGSKKQKPGGKKASQASNKVNASAHVKLKRRKLKVDEEAERIQADALKKVLERGLMESDALDLDSQHGKVLPNVLLRCNMSQVTVKKASRKRERKLMFVFPGQLAVLDQGVSGRLEGLSTNSPTLTLDLSGGATVEFYGSVVRPKNDYVVLECKQNGKQVNCHDGFTSLVVFHSYKILGKLSSEDTEAPELASVQWENPPSFEKEEEKAEEVEEDEEAQETDEEQLDVRKPKSAQAKDNVVEKSEAPKRKKPSRSKRSRKAVSYVESGGEEDGEETPESEGGYD